MISPHRFIQAAFLLAGIVTFLASFLNWEWFFSANNMQFVVRRLGRRWTRVLYGFLGVLLIGLSVFFYYRTV